MDTLPKLDWVSRHDPRSRNYSIAAVLGDVDDRPKTWRKGHALDQGREGACVGFAWTAELIGSPKPNYKVTPDVGNPFALQIYRDAKKIDFWAGEDYEGTSVLAGAQVLQSRGFIESYRWAFNIDDVRKAVISEGPVVIGINWHEGMYRTGPGHLVDVTGPLVGGHALTLTAYHPRRRFNVNGKYVYHRCFEWRNSWGRAYGRGGNGYIRYEDLQNLLATNGEACVPMGRNRVAIV